MLFIPSLLTFVVAGTALAATPPGFTPSTDQDLELAFCDNLAVNGASIPQDETEMVPAVGTAAQLTGTFTIIMVDTDVPPSTPGGETGTFLHLIQTGLTSANVTAPIAGRDMFELMNRDDIEPLAAFIQPNPPSKAPTTHKYTVILLNNTDNDEAMAVLQTASQTRLGFSTADVVAHSGAEVVAATFFTVTNSLAVAEKFEVQELAVDMEIKRKLHVKRYPLRITTIQLQPSPAAPAGPAQIITINPNQPAASGAGNNNPIIVVPYQPGAQPEASIRTLTINPNQPAVPAPTAAPVSGQPPRFTLNTTQPTGQPQQAQETIIIIRLSQIQGGGNTRNISSITSFTTPKIPGDAPQTTAPASQSQGLPAEGQQSDAPFQNGTQPTSNPGASVGAEQPVTTGPAVVPAPTGGAGILMGTGDMYITFTVVGLSVLVATFVSL